jgi:uncharacterized protein YchJ
MTLTDNLPHYDAEVIGAMSVPDLIALLIRDEDRAPRNVIDECARRGETMVTHLRDVLAQGRGWADDGAYGDWWLLQHAVMILGLIPEASAGLLLVDYMRRIDEAMDENLQEWLSGRWPALFLNKPATILPAICALRDDRELEWFIRHDAVESVIALAQREGGPALDAALDDAAALADDESDDWDLRMMTGYTVLNFAPQRHRALLEKLAREQKGVTAVFAAADITEIYATGGAEKQWERFADPWEFYAPDAIDKRRQDWVKQDAAAALVKPVRTGPKIGRNDPCPCGSGKKYKKCCLAA